MAVKVKGIKAIDFTELVKKVNSFIKDKHVLSIQYQDGVANNYWATALITYSYESEEELRRETATAWLDSNEKMLSAEVAIGNLSILEALKKDQELQKKASQMLEDDSE